MKELVPCLVFALALLLIVSCTELNDGYQFGDLTRFTVREMIQIDRAIVQYCDETQDSKVRAAALLMLRQELPGISENGICQDGTEHEYLNRNSEPYREPRKTAYRIRDEP